MHPLLRTGTGLSSNPVHKERLCLYSNTDAMRVEKNSRRSSLIRKQRLVHVLFAARKIRLRPELPSTPAGNR